MDTIGSKMKVSTPEFSHAQQPREFQATSWLARKRDMWPGLRIIVEFFQYGTFQISVAVRAKMMHYYFKIAVYMIILKTELIGWNPLRRGYLAGGVIPYSLISREIIITWNIVRRHFTSSPKTPCEASSTVLSWSSWLDCAGCPFARCPHVHDSVRRPTSITLIKWFYLGHFFSPNSGRWYSQQKIHRAPEPPWLVMFLFEWNVL